MMAVGAVGAIAVGARVDGAMSAVLVVGGVGAMAVLGAIVVEAMVIGSVVGGVGAMAVRATVIGGTTKAPEANHLKNH